MKSKVLSFFLIVFIVAICLCLFGVLGVVTWSFTSDAPNSLRFLIFDVVVIGGVWHAWRTTHGYY